MRSKVLRVSLISIFMLGVVTVAALLAMSVTGKEIRAHARVPKTQVQALSGQPQAVAYDKHNLIRFHVIANSDSDRDQALKRKVRDLIVERMSPEFAKARNLNEARQIAKSHLEEIKQIASREVSSWGEQYTVKVQLGNFDFPIKTYGKLTLPAGNYEAVRVVIGQGQGANWWCVLFPPLCFVDVSRAMAPASQQVVTEEVYTWGPQTDTQIPQTYTQEAQTYTQETQTYPQQAQTYTEEPQVIKIKFKFLEIFGW